MGAERRRVAILGGGMAGLAAAWRLSEPGWQHELASITVYQRGWRLGGKGASGRGAHGRIEEHGLHLWLGYYENAFRLLRECYRELDRPTTNPDAPILTWQDALIPAPVVGFTHAGPRGWERWIADFRANDDLPGEPDEPGGVMTVVDFVRRSLVLLADFVASLPAPDRRRVVLSSRPAPPPPDDSPDMLTVLVSTATAAVAGAISALGADSDDPDAIAPLDRALTQIRATLAHAVAGDSRLQRSWQLASVVLATVRGIVADRLLLAPDGFAAIDDEDYRAWIRRHGAAAEAVEGTLVGGLYDLVFAHQDGDPAQASFGAGWGVFLSGKTFFDYKGAIFWKMTAGMGDVVFAPLYEALVRRGVRFELFHRLDGVHLSADRTSIEALTFGVQAHVTTGRPAYDPLVAVKGLPCFPSAPRLEQLGVPAGADVAGWERFGSPAADAADRRLVRGEDFDDVVLAVSVGMLGAVCSELVAASAVWRDMVGGIRTVATQAFQLWLREDEPSLGWPWPGSTTTGFVQPFDTWASMPQLIAAEDWAHDDQPRTIAYFCSTLRDLPGADHARALDQVRDNARRFIERDLPVLLPGMRRDGEVRWSLLCGSAGGNPDPLATQFFTANVDPSDRYVQSVAGTDRFRLRPDESGFENLYLAGDWTDCGLNAGCIEAAVISGLQAANAVVGRSRAHRIAGYYRL